MEEFDRELSAALDRAAERALPRLDRRMERFFARRARSLGLPLSAVVGLITFALGLFLGGYFYAQTHQGDWTVSSTEHFKVYSWRGIGAAERREALETLEGDLAEVEGLLERRYDLGKRGKITAIIYAEETPSETAMKLVGSLFRRLAPQPELLEEAAVIMTSLDRLRWDAPRELTRVLVPGGFRPFIDSGFRHYIAIRLDRAHAAEGLRLLDEVAAQAQAEGALPLRELLTGVFHSDILAELLWTDFVSFLARRWGLERFVALYEELNSSYHYGEDLAPLFQTHYGLEIEELERRWRAALADTPITARGRLIYRLAAERLLARYSFIRPFIEDKEGMDRLGRAILQALGGDLDSLDPTQVKQFIAYLSNPENYVATREAVEEALDLALSVSTASLYQYIPLERVLEFREGALGLKRYYTEGDYREFMERYLRLVDETLSRKKEGDMR